VQDELVHHGRIGLAIEEADQAIAAARTDHETVEVRILACGRVTSLTDHHLPVGALDDLVGRHAGGRRPADPSAPAGVAGAVAQVLEGAGIGAVDQHLRVIGQVRVHRVQHPDVTVVVVHDEDRITLDEDGRDLANGRQRERPCPVAEQHAASDGADEHDEQEQDEQPCDQPATCGRRHPVRRIGRRRRW
jgi:hypothetical protein